MYALIWHGVCIQIAPHNWSCCLVAYACMHVQPLQLWVEAESYHDKLVLSQDDYGQPG